MPLKGVHEPLRVVCRSALWGSCIVLHTQTRDRDAGGPGRVTQLEMVHQTPLDCGVLSCLFYSTMVPQLGEGDTSFFV